MELGDVEKYVIIAAACVLFVGLNVAVIICCCLKRKKSPVGPKLENAPPARAGNDYTTMQIPASPARARHQIKTMPKGREARAGSEMKIAMESALSSMADAITIDSSRLQLSDPIGQGHYGVVVKGRLFSKDGTRFDTVAVKTVLPGTDMDDMTSFLKEALRMKQFSHEHVLSMIGIVERDNRPFVILPYMANGDLKNYLQDSSRSFSVMDLMWLGLQVCKGMAYLAERKFVHRDLAARNCMVSDKGVVKVADFGLSHDLFDDEYYKVHTDDKALPVKWMAVECFVEKRFSEKSDVWSYGVLMWELLTRGKVPYPGKKHVVVIELVKRGNRLECPKHCPDDIFKLMMECWHPDPQQRPTFENLCLKIQLLINDNGGNSAPKSNYQNMST